METEIELKLLVADDADKVIQNQLVPALTCTVDASRLVLANYYYDSPQRDLRKYDMGFRIRTNKGCIEQTLKTRGTTIGGLHQRPEYNIALEQPQPELKLFANDIWPQDINVGELQKQLCLMFTTNFTRHVYLLTLPDNTQIELVWDKGEVATKQYKMPLCELELELKKGKSEHLFSLARRIAQLMPVRIGNASKAARGYGLVDGLENKLLPMPETLELAEHDSVEGAFIQAMEFALGYWQHHEAVYHTAPSANVLRAMYKGMKLVLTTLNVYQRVLRWDELSGLQATLNSWLDKWPWVEDLCRFGQLSSKATPKIKSLLKSPRLLAHFKDQAEALTAQHQPLSLLSEPNNILLQLDIAQLLFAKPWRQKSKGYLLANQAFAQQYLLDNKITELTSTTTPVPWSARNYIHHADDIEHQQHLDFLFGTLFTTEHQAEPRLWRDVGLGLDDLRLLTLLQQEIADLDIKDQDGILSACAEKITNLLRLMEGSRNKASPLMRPE